MAHGEKSFIFPQEPIRPQIEIHPLHLRIWAKCGKIVTRDTANATSEGALRKAGEIK